MSLTRITIDEELSKMATEQVGASAALDNILSETITAGIKNALSRGETKFSCPECGLPIPKYPGRYPVKCPDCGSMLDPRKMTCEPTVGQEE